MRWGILRAKLYSPENQKGVANVGGSVGKKDVVGCSVYRAPVRWPPPTDKPGILGMEKALDHAVLLITGGSLVVFVCVVFFPERHLRYSGPRHRSFLRTKFVTWSGEHSTNRE